MTSSRGVVIVWFFSGTRSARVSSDDPVKSVAVDAIHQRGQWIQANSLIE